MNVQQQNDLKYLYGEADRLADKPHLTPQEQRQYSNLLSKISAVKQGASLAELNRHELRETEVRHGLEHAELPSTLFTPEQRATHAAWRAFSRREKRAMEEGNLVEQIGTYSGIGYFVPTGFFYDLRMAMKHYEPLFDAENVTLIETVTASPIPLPKMDDTGNVATLLTEASQLEELDLSNVGNTLVGAYKFSAGKYAVSLEALDDVAVGLNEINNFKRIATMRFARGVGAFLMNGSGSDQPTGLLTALIASGISPVIAQGAASNDGGAETGANSIGSQDLANAYFAVDIMNRKSPKCAWLMADSTLQSLCKQLDKMGRPLIDIQSGVPMLYGKKVLISPNMPSISAGAQTVIFGDLSYFVVRHATSDSFVQLFTEAPGLIDNGLVAWAAFDRFDSNLIQFGANESPLSYIQQHT
jgi:HK97 family phage major capsid protein